MVGNAGKITNWLRDYRTPSWLRLAYRNTRSLNRFIFKRKGLKRTRAVAYLLTKPMRRTTAYTKIREVIDDHESFLDLHEEGEGVGFLKDHWSLVDYVLLTGKSYWNAIKIGFPLYDKSTFHRTTGYTSEGESRMMETSDIIRSQDSFYTMPVPQAKAILDIDTTTFYPRIVDRNFARIFMANQISNGGSWYILCRIYCAKRVLDFELRELGIRDPPHLRPDDDTMHGITQNRHPGSNESTRPDAPNPLYKDSIFEERMAQHQRSDELEFGDGRRTSVNGGKYKSQRKSKIDPRHGSKYGFSSTISSFGTRNYSTLNKIVQRRQNGSGSVCQSGSKNSTTRANTNNWDNTDDKNNGYTTSGMVFKNGLDWDEFGEVFHKQEEIIPASQLNDVQSIQNRSTRQQFDYYTNNDQYNVDLSKFVAY